MIDHLADHNIWIILGIKVFLVAAVFLPIIAVNALYCIWWERKVAGHIQSRVGPMHVGGWHGWAQTLADGIKLLFKEDLMPKSADAFLFKFAPYLAFAPVFAAFVVLPFGPQFIFDSGFSIGVLYVLAFLSVEIMAVIMAGWGSNSKWTVYGAMREACQMVSYEVPLGLSIITGVLVAGTLNLVELGYLQGGGLWDWFIFHNPFIFLAFIVYYIASLASNKRAPFDLPESESELVAGFHTEYSGLRWSIFFMAEYGAMFVVGAVQAALFLGCWNSPLGTLDPIYHLCGYDPVAAGQAFYDGSLATANTFDAKAAVMNAAAPGGAGSLTGIGLFVINLYGAFWLIAKAMVVIFVQIWVRWTLPRIRIDQVLYACIKVLLPLSIITLVGAAAWVWLVPQATGLVTGARPAAMVRVTPDAEGRALLKLDAKQLVPAGDSATHVKLAGVTHGDLFRVVEKEQVGEGGVKVKKSQNVHIALETGIPLAEATGTYLYVGPKAVAGRDAAQETITLIPATIIERTGQLVGQTHWLQAAVQFILMMAALLVLLIVTVIGLMGWKGVLFKDNTQPPKSLFPDVMPVGNTIAFTKGPTA
jgi:NADH-quinone oxidoreductase subunit H